MFWFLFKTDKKLFFILGCLSQKYNRDTEVREIILNLDSDLDGANKPHQLTEKNWIELTAHVILHIRAAVKKIKGIHFSSGSQVLQNNIPCQRFDGSPLVFTMRLVFSFFFPRTVFPNSSVLKQGNNLAAIFQPADQQFALLRASVALLFCNYVSHKWRKLGSLTFNQRNNIMENYCSWN